MRSTTALVSIAILALLTVGCGDSAKKGDSSSDIAAEFAKVRAARTELNTVRGELKEIHAELQALDSSRRLSDEEQARKQELENKLRAGQTRYDEAFTKDQAALSAFLTTTLNDEQLRQADETRTALGMYAEEAVTNANEFMDQSGDYRRAIELLENAQNYFEFASMPAPEGLLSTLEKAKSMRYLTQERFDQVKKGMSPEQVKGITGTPYYMNIRESEAGGRKVTTWLFNREDGNVSAIYFVKNSVYATKWDVKQG